MLYLCYHLLHAHQASFTRQVGRETHERRKGDVLPYGQLLKIGHGQLKNISCVACVYLRNFVERLTIDQNLTLGNEDKSEVEQEFILLQTSHLNTLGVLQTANVAFL